jgi:hypothetical protein
MATGKKKTSKKTGKKKSRAKSTKELVRKKPADDLAAEEEMEGEFFDKKSLPAVTDPLFVKYDIAKRVAHTLACSNLVPDAYRGKPNDVFVAINMGSELGMEPFQAIQSIAVIEGKPCLYGDGLIGVVRASSKCEWIEETLNEDGDVATCRTQRRGDPNPVIASYSIADAVQAGLHNKFNWKKHPKRMLQMRARAYCLRDAYPDLLKGLGVVEERMDHEDTPPPITQYTLPKASGGEQAESRQPNNDQATVTLAQVESAINKASSMEQLLETSNLAKQLGKLDSQTARLTYKLKRDILQSQSEVAT